MGEGAGPSPAQPSDETPAVVTAAMTETLKRRADQGGLGQALTLRSCFKLLRSRVTCYAAAGD